MGREVNKDTLKDGAILDDRECTDICMIIFAIIFIILWIVVGVVAVTLGKPSRIVLPENFRGDLCGDTGAVNEDVPFLFIPKPSRLSYGICTPRCPATGDYVCNNDIEPLFNDTSIEVRNDYYNHNAAEYSAGYDALAACVTECTAEQKEAARRYEGLVIKLAQYKCFFAFYTTGSTLYRCLPFNTGSDNATLAEQAGESNETVSKLSEWLGVGTFFTRGFGEVSQCRWVILICAFTACFISIIWIILLRCIMAPLIYLCILLIFCLLIAIGYFAKLMADDLEKVVLPGDTATQDQVIMWRIVQYVFWIAAGIYFVAMVWMLKRIRIGIAVMKEGSKAFQNNIPLIIIPPIVFILVLGWILFFIIMSLYIQTIGQVTTQDFEVAARDTYGDAAVNRTIALGSNISDFVQNCTESCNSTVNTSQWETSDIVKAMHAYNFFGFLWAANFCICWGFFIQAFVATTWYYSATTEELLLEDDGIEGGRLKGSPTGAICRCFCSILRYHLGTILWGSLLIAIIQFVRVMFLYIQEEFLDSWKEMELVRCLIYVIDCCLAYIERVIKVISKNAFIVCCASSENFCTCAQEAVSILFSNAARVSILALMSSIAYFVLKLFIVCSNMILAWVLINTIALTEEREVESGLFPMIGIFIMTFIIASLFVSVYESCTDTVMMCFLYDETHLDGGTFMPISLSKLVDAFAKVEKSKQEYEKGIRDGIPADDDDSHKKNKKVD